MTDEPVADVDDAGPDAPCGECIEPEAITASPGAGALEESVRPPNRIWLPLAALAVALVEAGLLVTHRLPLGIPGVWVWPERNGLLTPGHFALGAVLFLVLASLTAGDAIRKRREPGRAYGAFIVLALTVAQAVFTLGLALDEPEWPVRIAGSALSDQAMGYYSVATKVRDVPQFLHDYHLHLTGPGAYPSRVATHPPGAVLLFYGLRKTILSQPMLLIAADRLVLRMTGLDAGVVALGASVTSTARMLEVDGLIALMVGVSLALLAALCVPTVYWLTAQLFGRRTGVLAALLTAGLPTLGLFVPCIDGVAGALALATMAALLWGLRSRRPLALGLAGLLWGIGILWTYGLLSLVIPTAMLVGPALRRGTDALGTRGALVRALLAVLVGAALPFVALVVWGGYQPLGAFVGSMEAQKEVMRSFGRAYAVWVPMNLWDVIVFLGAATPIVVVGVCASLRRRPWTDLAALLALGAIAQLVFVLLSGQTRGEVGRIWLPQMLLFLPFAASALAPLTEGRMLASAGLLAAAQAAVMVALYATLRVVGF